MKKIVSLMVLLMLFSACNYNLHVEKRHYKKGFYFSYARHKAADLTKKSSIVKRTQNEGPDALLMASAETSENSLPYFAAEKSAESVSFTHASTFSGKLKTADAYFPADKKTRPQFGQFHNDLKNVSTATHKKNADHGFLLFAALFAGAMTAFLLAFFSKAKKIMRWASLNVGKVRFLITASRITLALTAIFAGRQMADHGIFTSQLSTHSLSIAAILSVLFYPLAKKSALLVNSVKRQKIAALLIGLSGVLLITNISNRFASDRSSAPVADHFLNTFSANAPAGQEKTKELPEKQRNYTTEDIIINILLTLALLALVTGLLMITAVVSCNLSCSGQEALAALVGIGGVAISLFLLIYLSILIWRPRKKAPQTAS